MIFLTARTEIDDIVRGFEVGAVDYITKPLSPRTWQESERISALYARISAHDLNKEKDEFLGIAAHDLRNQLSKSSFIAEMAYRRIVHPRTHHRCS